MLKRLAVVLWWLGALTFAGALVTGGSAMTTEWHCASELAKVAASQKAIDQRAAQLAEEYRKAGRNPYDAFDQSSENTSDPEALHKIAVAVCHATARSYWGSTLAAAAGGLALFALAFVFGGRFWLPPRTT